MRQESLLLLFVAVTPKRRYPRYPSLHVCRLHRAPGVAVMVLTDRLAGLGDTGP